MSEKKDRKLPRTNLKFKELLDGYSISELANYMGVTYTQLYPYKKRGANPTLLVLEQLAVGLSELRKEQITVADLLGINTNTVGIKRKRSQT